MELNLYIGNDNVIEWRELKNNITGAYINDAVVAVTLKDSNDDEVVGQGWPVTLVYVAASNGVYRANLEDSLTLTNKAFYTALIAATGDGLTGLRKKTVQAIERTD